MLDEIQTFWQNLSPEIQTAAQIGSLLLGALVGGHYLGVMVGRALRAKNFDAVLRPPSSSSAGAETEHGFTPTWIAGMLVRLTVWAVAAWWLARQYNRPDIAGTLTLIISRTWALATILVAALALGSLLSRRLIDSLQGPKTAAEAAKNGASQRGAAGAVGAVVYTLAVLIVLLIAADAFDWP